MSWADERAGADQRYACAACGKATEPGGARLDLRDVSCALHAVLVHKDKVDGKWQAVSDNPVLEEPQP